MGRHERQPNSGKGGSMEGGNPFTSLPESEVEKTRPDIPIVPSDIPGPDMPPPPAGQYPDGSADRVTEMFPQLDTERRRSRRPVIMGISALVIAGLVVTGYVEHGKVTALYEKTLGNSSTAQQLPDSRQVGGGQMNGALPAVPSESATSSEASPTPSDSDTESASPTPSGSQPESGSPTPSSSASPSESGSPSVTPTDTPSGEPMPVGNLTGYKQVFAEDFNGIVPPGAFSGCDNKPDTPQASCSGLKKYPTIAQELWAYPKSYTSAADKKASVAEHPEDTISINNGNLVIAPHRPESGGDTHIASLVPLASMNQTYGIYKVRMRVARADPGFGANIELVGEKGETIKFPSGNFLDSNSQPNNVGASIDPGGSFQTAAKWADWHTDEIVWEPGKLQFFEDGITVGSVTENVPNTPMSWAWQFGQADGQNKPAPGAEAEAQIAWATYYKPAESNTPTAKPTSSSKPTPSRSATPKPSPSGSATHKKTS